MKSKIVFEKTYYLPTFLEDKKPNHGGILFIRTFRISQTSKRMFLRMKRGILGFHGANREQMINELRHAIRGKTQLPQEADGDNSYIPREVRAFLSRHTKLPLKVEL